MLKRTKNFAVQSLAYLRQALNLLNRPICEKAFDFFFVPTILSLTLLFIFGPEQNLTHGLLIGSLVAIFPSLCLSHSVYERFIGPRLRKRGWNERSFGRGLELVFLLVLVFWIMPPSGFYGCLAFVLSISLCDFLRLPKGNFCFKI